MEKLKTAQEKYEFAIKVLQRKSREYNEAEDCIEEIRDAYGFNDDLPIIIRESFVELEIAYRDKQDALHFVSESLKVMIDSDNDFETYAAILYSESKFDEDENEDFKPSGSIFFNEDEDEDEIPNADGTYPSDFDNESEY